jgi:hypothetical protein
MGVRVLHYRFGSTSLHGIRSIRSESREIQIVLEVKNSKVLEKATKSLFTRLALVMKAEHKKKRGTHTGPVFTDRFKSWTLRSLERIEWAKSWLTEAQSEFRSWKTPELAPLRSAMSPMGQLFDRLLC